ncbi:MAG: T9SS type A sorting domain-containing protein, partial [bacterium]
PEMILTSGGTKSAIVATTAGSTNYNDLIKLYPNPVTNGILNLETTDFGDNIQVNIYDIMGKKIVEKNYYNQENIKIQLVGLKETFLVSVHSGKKDFVNQLIFNRLINSKK